MPHLARRPSPAEYGSEQEGEMTALPRWSDTVHRFGGSGPLVHVAHANGFPPGTYRALAETMLPDWQVIGLPSRPLWPGSRPSSAPTWRPMAADLATGLEDLGAREVLGLGHSLGGVLTLWAAISHPHLFRAIVLIDPVILSPARLRVQWGLGMVGLAHRQPLVRRALRRRQEWPNQQACFDHLRGKPLFASWPEPVLWDYVRYGTRVGAGDSVQLVYPPAWEAQIFATAPTDIWRDLRRAPARCLFVRGERSTTFTAETMDRIGGLLPSVSLVTIPGAGHLLPMEAPEAVGIIIRRFFEGLPPVQGPDRRDQSLVR